MNYLYQITNLINNKIYVGIHKTANIDDGYMGSGKIIKSAIEKYGIENFRKDILEFFDTYDLALSKESEIVTDEFLLREDVYNLRKGGSGGFDYINRADLSGATEHGRLGGIKTKEVLENNPGKKEKRLSKFRKYLTKDHSDGNRRHTNFGNAPWTDKARFLAQSVESIQKRKDTYRTIGHQQGMSNSQFGKYWITNGTNSKKIRKDDPIPEGWKKGRILRD
jgi:hypothetical protein